MFLVDASTVDPIPAYIRATLLGEDDDNYTQCIINMYD